LEGKERVRNNLDEVRATIKAIDGSSPETNKAKNKLLECANSLESLLDEF